MVSEGVCRHLVVLAVGVDGAEHGLVAEHHRAIEGADVDIERMSGSGHAGEAYDPSDAVRPRISRMSAGAPVHSIRMSGAEPVERLEVSVVGAAELVLPAPASAAVHVSNIQV